MKKQFIAATLIAAAMLAGCGGGGSSAPTATVAGKVADGYLEKATVFMDKNGNYQLDAGEPSAITNDKGEYTLTVDPADVGKYPIIARADVNVTIDKDTNTAVAHSYIMSLPKESVTGTVSSNFVSPMSTQLREMMESGSYAGMQDAMADLRTRLGVAPGTNIMGDYIAGQNNTLHIAARNMAQLMGEQQSLMFRNYSGATHLDVTRYRGMMGAIFSNMSAVRTGTQMPQMTSGMTSNLSNITAGTPSQNTLSFTSGMSWGGSMMGGR